MMKNNAVIVALIALCQASALVAAARAGAGAGASGSLRRLQAVASRQAPIAFADGLGAHAVASEPEHHDAEPDEHSGKPGAGGEPMVPRTHEEGEAEKKHEWTYASPETWVEGYADCGLKAQSPINLAKPPHSHDSHDKLDYNYHPLQGLHIDNNGHNVQVNGEFGTLRLPDGNYNVAQLHFHFPSEHEVDGKLMAGEMHIVHQKAGATGTNDLAVVGVLFEVGDGDGIDFLKNLGFASGLPKQGEQKPIEGPVDIGQSFVRELVGDFYHYQGSLTTPPCSETVHWFVLEKTAKVTAEMVSNFKALFPDPQNNRPVQPLNGRELVEDSFKVKGEYEHGAAAGAWLPVLPLALLLAFNF